MTAPHVLVLGSVFHQDMGGVRRHNAELLPRVAKLLEASGGSLSVVLGKGGLGFELPPNIERLQTTIQPSPPLVRATLEGRWLRRILAEAESTGRAFDLIHTAHHPVPRHLPVPHSLLVHDLRALSLEHSPMSRRLFARQILGHGIERAVCVQTVSEAVRVQVLSTFRIEPEKVSVVPNGADHLDILPRTATPDAKLLVLGHVEPRKNLKLVIQALACDATLPAVQIVGKAKGAERKRLEAQARELGVLRRVEFQGPVEDAQLPALYASAACVVCPSKLEGFGIVAVEAARALAPLAVSDIPAHIEVVSEHTPRFETSDAQSCARAIHAAISAGAQLRAQARDFAEQFRWDTAAEQLAAAWCTAHQARGA